MTQRIHKVLLDGTRNLFSKVADQDGKQLDLNKTAQLANPAWEPYSDVCVETYEVLPIRGADGKHNRWVLRGNARCSCLGNCHYPEDHVFANAAHGFVNTKTKQGASAKGASKHGKSGGYVEGFVNRADLANMHKDALNAAQSTSKAKELGTVLSQTASGLELSAFELENELGIEGKVNNGKLSAVGAVQTVFDGTSTQASDYYAVAVIIKLHESLIERTHALMASDIPRHDVHETITLSPRLESAHVAA